MGYYALGSLEICKLGQNSNCYPTVFDELTDICMEMYVEVDWTRIHLHLKRLFWGSDWRGGGGGEHKVFSPLQEGNRKFLEAAQGGNRCFFDIRFQFQEPPPGGNKWYFP